MAKAVARMTPEERENLVSRGEGIGDGDHNFRRGAAIVFNLHECPALEEENSV